MQSYEFIYTLAGFLFPRQYLQKREKGFIVKTKGRSGWGHHPYTQCTTTHLRVIWTVTYVNMTGGTTLRTLEMVMPGFHYVFNGEVHVNGGCG